MGQALASRDNSENEHVAAKEETWFDARQAHNQVTWNFDEDERDKEDPDGGIEAILRHVEAFLQTLNPGIGDYDT
jgi:hypothetical protein